MALDDIQLNIVVNLQGDRNIDAVNRKLRDTSQIADGVRRNQDAVVSVNRNSVKSWQDLAKQLGAVEREYDALYRAGVHMTQMGHDLIGVSKRIMETGMGIVDAYADYDLMLRRGAVALNTNAEWQGKLDQAIQKTAISLGLFSPEQVAEGYYVWGAAAGMVVDTQEELAQVSEVVEAVMIATAMAGGSLEGNLNGVYAVMSQFNLPAERATDVVEGLALMTERTAAQFSDLTSAFTFIGPFADELGVKFEDVTSMLGLLADNGTKGSRAGRGLQMMLEGLSAPSGPAKKALDSVAEAALGVGAEFRNIVFDENGQFKGMRAFVMDMAKGLKEMTQEERGYVYAKGFTNNATRAFIPLINEQIALLEKGADAHGNFTSALDAEKYSLEGAGHFFEIMREQATGSINAVVGSLRNSFFPILQLVATRIMEMATPVMDRIKQFADAFRNWLDQNPEIVDMAVKLGALVAVVTALAGAFFLFAGTLVLMIAHFGNVANGIGRVIGPFVGLSIVLGGLVALVASNFGGIRDAFENLGAAIGEFIDALDMGDVSFASVLTGIWELAKPSLEQAVRALADGINWLADKIRELTGNEQFMDWAREAAGWLITIATVSLGLRTAMTTLSVFTGSLWALGVIWKGVSKMLMAGPIIGALRGLAGIVAGLGGAFMALSTPLKFLVGGLTVVGVAIAAAFLAYETNFLGFRDFVNGIVSWLVETIPGVVANVISFFQSLGGNIVGVWNNIIAVVGPIMQAFIGPFVALAERGIPALIAKMQEFWAMVAPIFGSIRDTVVEVFTNVVIPAWDSLIAKVGEFVAFVVPLLGEFLSSFMAFMGPILEFLAFALPIAWEFLVELTGNFLAIMSMLIMMFAEQVLKVLGPWIETLIRIVGVLWETVVGIFNAALDIIMGVFQLVFGTISEIFKAFAALFRGDLSAFWEHVTAAFWTAVDGILRIIGGLVSGIWTAFTGMVAVVWELVTGFLSGIVGLFPDFVQDWIKAGGDVVRGLWEGITGLFRWVWNKISGFFGDIVDNVKGFLGIKSPSTVFADMGKAIVRGIWDGISGLAQWLWNKVSGWVGSIVDNVLGFFGIESPSKVFADIGKHLVEGLAVGIDKTPDALESIQRYSNSLLDIAENAKSAGSAFEADFSASAGLALESDSEKRIKIELDLTSSDGSYDDATLDQLKAALTSTDLVRAIEHMAGAQ